MYRKKNSSVGSTFQLIALLLSVILIVTTGMVDRLEAASTTPIEIENAGFENGMEGWIEQDPSAISGVAYEGAKSLKIDSSPGRVHQIVDVLPNTEYTLSAYVSGKGQIGVDDLNGLFGAEQFDVSGWTLVSESFTTNAGTTSLHLFASHDNSSSSVRFDNFSLVQEEQTATISTSIPDTPEPEPTSCTLTTANLTATDDGLNDGHGPQLAVDGNYTDLNSRWSANGDGRWLQLDLGSTATVSQLATAWFKADVRTAIFDVEISVDGTNWTRILTDAQSQGNIALNIDDLGDVTARYVRIVGHGNTSNSWNSILEVEIKTCDSVTVPTEVVPTPVPTEVVPTLVPTEIVPTSAPTEVIPTTTSCALTIANLTATDEGLNDGHGPQLAVDGNYTDLNSRWSANGSGRWLQLDLGGTATVSQLATAWFKADIRTATFDVEISVDGSNWTRILTDAQSQGNISLNTDDLGDVTARYIRIIGYGNTSNSWNSILEVEIKTCGAVVVPTPSPTEIAPTPNSAEDLIWGDLIWGDLSIETCTPIPASLTDGTVWELEGKNPHPLVDACAFKFVALEAQYVSPNGSGWRHEYKITRNLRLAMTETYEDLRATAQVDMSNGGKTIIAQHHASDTGTIMKLYVADSSELGFFDSVADNGIFDVYVRILNTSGVEEKKPLGTIQSGDSFSFQVINDYGVVKVSAFGESLETQVEDDSASYLKFGNYLQSQNPYGSVNCGEKGNSDSFAECYEELGITEAIVTMTDVSYERIIASSLEVPETAIPLSVGMVGQTTGSTTQIGLLFGLVVATFTFVVATLQRRTKRTKG